MFFFLEKVFEGAVLGLVLSFLLGSLALCLGSLSIHRLGCPSFRFGIAFTLFTLPPMSFIPDMKGFPVCLKCEEAEVM